MRSQPADIGNSKDGKMTMLLAMTSANLSASWDQTKTMEVRMPLEAGMPKICSVIMNRYTKSHLHMMKI